MKIALVHDYIKEYGGAERVLEALHELYPDAPVFTSVYLPQYLGPHKTRFKGWNIKTTWLQYLPVKAKLISPMRLLAPFAFHHFDFSEFDAVIVSATGGYIPNMIQTGKAKHICYCHTPPRFLYGYATARDWKKRPMINALAEMVNHVLRIVDYHASKNVSQYIANSEEVKGRIKKFYRQDAVVIYPPVETSIKYQVSSIKDEEKKNTKYYLAGGRLARPKHIDLIVRVCSDNNIPLKVFGKDFAGYGDEINRIAGKTVKILGEVSDEEKYEWMKNAKAYIFAAEDEDFGITPIEAMACGTPVIAYRSGGVKETVVDGKTGIFFDQLTNESLTNAIKKFEKIKLTPEACREHAEKFSKERFKEKIRRLVKEQVNA